MAGFVFQVLVITFILRSSVTEDKTTEQCSVDGKCEEEQHSHRYSEKGQFSHVEKFVRNSTALRLLRAQTEVAKYLEIGYLAVSDFPELSRKVRMDAHKAKTQHMMTTALMKDYMVTTAHVLDTVLPLVRRAVDTKDKDLFGRTLGRISQIAEEMKEEAQKAKREYEQIHISIEELLIKVQDTSTKAKDTIKELETEKQRNTKLIKVINSEKSQLEGDIEGLEVTISNMVIEAEKLKESIDKHSYFNRAKGLVSGLIGAVANWFGVGQITGIAKSSTDLMFSSIEELKSKYKEMLSKIEQSKNKKSTLQKQLNSIKREKIDKLANLNLLDLKEVKMGDISSLDEAYDGITSTTDLFDKIVKFLDDMITAIKHNKRVSETGKSTLKPETFLPHIKNAERSWAALGKMCQYYVNKCERHEHTKVSELYRFMKYQLSMADEERQARMTEIANELHYTLKQEIENNDEQTDGL